MSEAVYEGPERRRRVAYLTRNTEYHLENGVCVAVRDRASGNWQLCHDALGRRISAAVRQKPGLAPYPALEAPAVGDALFFAKYEAASKPEVLTSSLLSIERPPRATVDTYPV